jgi:integrase
MKAKINKSLVNTLKPGDKDIKIRDTELAGFELKLTPKGKIVYRVDYRINGERRCVTVGNSSTTPDQARALAARTLQAVAAGENPAEDIAEAKRDITVAELAERYLAEHAGTKKKPRSAHEDARLINKTINPEIGKRKVAGITRADIAKLHHEQRETPYQANRVLALLRKMMNLAESWGLRPVNSNPCIHIEKFKEEKRRRFLDAEELARLGAVLNEAEEQRTEPVQALAAIRLLIFTGARRDEILTAKWQYVKRGRNVLELPDSKTGFKQIPLSAPALEILDNLPVVPGNDYLIPGKKSGAHYIGLQDVWERIRAKSGLKDVRIHDLRHTFTSTGASSGLALPVIGGLLGHKNASTTQRYAHLQADPLHDAAETIGEQIDRAMKKKPRRLRAVK